MTKFTPEFDKWFKQSMVEMQPENKKATGSGGINTAKFDAQPQSVKSKQMSEAIKSAKIPK